MSELRPERFDGAPLTLDSDHADLGWTISEPIPYYPQRTPKLRTRVAVLTVFRKFRCQAVVVVLVARDRAGRDMRQARGENVSVEGQAAFVALVLLILFLVALS